MRTSKTTRPKLPKEYNGKKVKRVRANKPLPNTLGEMVELALDDVIKVHKSKEFRLNMSNWGSSIGSVCEVCLGGSIIMGEYNLSSNEYIDWATSVMSINNKLIYSRLLIHNGEYKILTIKDTMKIQSMDYIRSGIWGSAIMCFYGISYTNYLNSKYYKQYHKIQHKLPYGDFNGRIDNFKEFSLFLRKVIRLFKSVNL